MKEGLSNCIIDNYYIITSLSFFIILIAKKIKGNSFIRNDNISKNQNNDEYQQCLEINNHKRLICV